MNTPPVGLVTPPALPRVDPGAKRENATGQPADSFQPTPVADLKLIPRGEARAQLNVTLSLPASLVPGLPGLALALVPEAEVSNGRWQPTSQSQVIVPHVLHATTSERAPEGQAVALLATPFLTESLESLGPSQTGGYYLTGPQGGAVGQDLPQAAQSSSGNGLLHVSLGIPAEMTLEQMSGKTLALVPRQELTGNQFTPAPAPDVERCIHYPGLPEGQQMVNFLVRADAQALEERPDLVAMAYFNPSPAPPDWVSAKLEQHGVTIDAAQERLNRLAGGERPTREELADPDARKLLASADFLHKGLLHLLDRERYGVEAMEVLKASVANGLPPVLPAQAPPEDAERLVRTAGMQAGKVDPFADFAKMKVCGERTSVTGLRHTLSMLDLKSPVLDRLMARQSLLGQEGDSLGALKATSDKMILGLKIKRVTDGLLAASSTLAGLAVAGLTGQAWIAGLGVLGAVSPGRRVVELSGQIKDEQAVNRILEEAIGVAKRGENLVEFVEKRMLGGPS